MFRVRIGGLWRTNLACFGDVTITGSLTLISYGRLSNTYRCLPLHSLRSPPEPWRPVSLLHVIRGFQGQDPRCPRLLGCRGPGPHCGARPRKQIGRGQCCAGLPELSQSGRRLVLDPGRWERTRGMKNNHARTLLQGRHFTAVYTYVGNFKVKVFSVIWSPDDGCLSLKMQYVSISIYSDHT